MKTKIIFLLIIISFFSCNNNSTPSGNDLVFDETEAIIESIWTIQKITIKNGTDNPDEVVPPSQMEEISSGDKLAGEIDFISDSTININNGSDEFYLDGLNDYKRSYEDKFIRFKHSYGGFGYKVQWFGDKHMRWYIESIGIESGSKSVRIIEMQAIN